MQELNEKAAEQLEIPLGSYHASVPKYTLNIMTWTASIRIVGKLLGTARSQHHLKSMNRNPWWWCMPICCACLVCCEALQPRYYKTWQIPKGGWAKQEAMSSREDKDDPE